VLVLSEAVLVIVQSQGFPIAITRTRTSTIRGWDGRKAERMVKNLLDKDSGGD